MAQAPWHKHEQEVLDKLGVLDDAVWDDLRFPTQAISIGGLSTPPDIQTDTGLFLFDGGTSIETVAFLAQLPHSWKEGTSLAPHVHWRKTSDAAGDVVWTMRYKIIPYDGLETAWSSIVVGTDTNTVDATQKQVVTTFGEIDMTGYSISTMLLMQMGRLPTDAGDTYAADALVYEFDIHYQIDSNGSVGPFSKHGA